jgi:HemX protein
MLAHLSDRQWLWCAAAFYLAGFLLGTAELTRRMRPSRGLTYALIAIGYVLQLGGLGLRGRAMGSCPLGNTFEVLQFVAWSSISLYLLVGVTFRSSLFGYLTAALTAALTLISLSVPHWDTPARTPIFGGNPWIDFHAALATFSYGVFGLLALTSLLFLLRHYSLKSKRLDGVFVFLPSIFDLDKIGVRLLAVGVVLLAASLTVGTVYWAHVPGIVDLTKFLCTLGVGIAYAATLALRLRGTLLSRRFAWTCLVLFIAALLSLAAVDSSRHPNPAKPRVEAR